MSAGRNRASVIFRLRAESHLPNGPPIDRVGVTDHPDRGYQHGEWPDTPGVTVNPFERSKHLLCNPWEVWAGLQEIVAEEEAKEHVTAKL